MKSIQLFAIGLFATCAVSVFAQTNLPIATNSVESAATNTPAPYVNRAIVPGHHIGGRTDLVMQRAKNAPGDYDIAFIGDSITEGWERSGTNVWRKFYGGRKCINFGVGGDRTENVLWRFEHGQLDGVKPKVAVLMIGTNNSGKEKDGKLRNSEKEILEGVQAVVKQIRARLPDTKLLVLGIFPRSQTFSEQRGQVVQVNQALAKLADGQMIHYLDFGSQLIEADGSLSKAIMPDYLHLSEKGYTIWAEAIEPKLKELLAN